jgi:hypothetical protein
MVLYHGRRASRAASLMLSWEPGFSAVPAAAQSAWKYQEIVSVDMPGRSGRVEVDWSTR